MNKNKCCGNCNSFIPSIDGFGACTEPSSIYCVHCNNDACSLFKMKSNNGWIEITPDNVDEIDAIDPNRVVIATIINDGIILSSVRTECDITLKACSEFGGYFYYVLPELKIE